MRLRSLYRVNSWYFAEVAEATEAIAVAAASAFLAEALFNALIKLLAFLASAAEMLLIIAGLDL